MTYTLIIFISFCGLFKVYLSQPETTKEAELKKLGNYHAKLNSDGTKEDELIRIANELVRLDECEEAIPFFTKAIKQSNLDPEYYLKLGNCYEKMNKMDEAINGYKNALQKKPNDKLILEKLILTLFKTKQIDEAAKELVGLDEAQLQSMGDALITQERKYAEALHCFTEAIRKNPDNSYSHEKAAECYWMNGDFDMAKLETDRAVNLLQQNNQHRIDLELTWCKKLVKAGKFPEARFELNNLEAQRRGSAQVAFRVQELREKIIQMEQEMKAPPSFE